MNIHHRLLLFNAAFLISISSAFGLAATAKGDREVYKAALDPLKYFRNYNVVWDSPSHNSAESMPLAGGEIGCNVWVENGDLLFYAQQSGSFDKNGEYIKMGRFRIRFDPNPFAAGCQFKQEFRLREGYVQITAEHPSSGKVTVNLWVEVKRPVIHVDVNAVRKIGMTASYESWRFNDVILAPEERPPHEGRRASLFDFDCYQVDVVKKGDIIEPGQNSILWCQDNGTDFNAFDFSLKIEELEAIRNQMWNPLRHLVSGGMMRSTELEFSGTSDATYFQTPYRSWHFKSKQPTQTYHLEIIGRVAHAETFEVWKAGLLTQAGEKVDPSQLWNNNQAWWKDFWNRGYVIINPDKDSNDNGWRVGRNYNLFRYHIGGNFYGKVPTKFNGGNFTFDPGHVDKEYPYDPDYRRWGGWSYTSANQTLLYWSFLKNGDFEGMIPEFDVYRNGLVNAEARTKAHFGHDGCSFAEQLQLSGMPVVAMYGFVEHGYSWRGGRPKDFEKGELFNPAISTYYHGQLEHAFMILEYHRFSGRDISAYMPFILSCVKFYDQHYQMKHRRNTGYLQQLLDDQGKLVIFPSTAGEGGLNSTNPADAIAGLLAITRALLDLPGPALSAEQRNYIAEFQNRIPALPVSRKIVDGKERTLLNISLNNEDQVRGVYPNLQSTWPYNLFYIGAQDFDRAFDTWKYKVSQEAKQKWEAISRSVIFSARMGLTDEAKFTISRKMDDRSGNNSRFPTFVGPGVDWSPDHNWLGCGMIGLQEMLLQTPGREIRLLPAWPKDWDVAFKLHAPYDTTIEGIFENGEMKSLKVTPKARERDVIYPSTR